MFQRKRKPFAQHINYIDIKRDINNVLATDDYLVPDALIASVRAMIYIQLNTRSTDSGAGLL